MIDFIMKFLMSLVLAVVLDLSILWIIHYAFVEKYSCKFAYYKKCNEYDDEHAKKLQKELKINEKREKIKKEIQLNRGN